MPGLQARPPVGVCERQLIEVSLTLSMLLSLSFSLLPPSLKINEIFKITLSGGTWTPHRPVSPLTLLLCAQFVSHLNTWKMPSHHGTPSVFSRPQISGAWRAEGLLCPPTFTISVLLFLMFAFSSGSVLSVWRTLLSSSFRTGLLATESLSCPSSALFCFLRFLFIFRVRGKKGEREKNIDVWLPLVCPPYWGPGLQPRHVP